MTETGVRVGESVVHPDELWELYASSKVEILILTGSAGTGKTTLVGKLVDLLASKGQRSRLLATTGRAAKILAERTGKPASTIHSAIYRFRNLKGHDSGDDDMDLTMDQAGQLYLQFDLRGSGPEEEVPHVYIIDEASMLTHERTSRDHAARFGSGSLLDDLVAFSESNKLIFVGDSCQLPPIAQNPMSSALNPELLAERYGKGVGLIELKKVWRQHQGNEILDLATWYRDRISEGRAFKGMKIPPPGGRQVHLVKDLNDLVSEYIKVIGPERNYQKATFIAASNKMVGQINADMRRKLGYADRLEVGEILSVVQNSYTTPLMNGDLVVVEEIRPDARRAGFSFSKVRVRTLHNQEVYETLMIDDLLYNSEASLNREDAGKLIVDYDQRMRNKGFKRKTLEYRNGLQKDPYLNALRCKFGYALTCHKAQGGEWDEVFVGLNGSQYYMDGEVAARWYYTAFTRAKQNLYLNEGIWIGTPGPKVRIIRPVVRGS